MILNRTLTAEERRISQRCIETFHFGNGMSYMCLGESILVLFAARLGAPNAVVALLGAMQYLGYALLPLGVWRTAVRGAAASQSDFWLARNAAALLTASAALVWRVSPAASWGLLLFGAFVFYGCRAAGCVLTTPLVGDISTEEEAPGVIGATSALFNVSGVAALAAITWVTHRWGGLDVLALVIVTGSLLGMGSTAFLRGVRETGAIRDAARAPLLDGMREALRNRDLVRLSVAWFLLNLSLILLVPLSMLALKRGCGFGDSRALLCACAQFAGGIVASFASGRLCRTFGPRLVLLVGAVLCATIPPLWLVFPAESAPLCWGLALFFWLGLVFYLVYNATNSYFLLACPDKRAQVSGSVAVNLVASAGAGAAASLLGAWLISRSTDWAASLPAGIFGGSLGPFRLFFLLLFPVFAAALVASLHLPTKIYAYRRSHGDRALRRAIALGHHRKH